MSDNVIQFKPRALMPPIEEPHKLDRAVFKELCLAYDSADDMLASVLLTLRHQHRVDLRDERYKELKHFLRDTIVSCVLATQDIYHPMQEIAKDFWEGSHLD